MSAARRLEGHCFFAEDTLAWAYASLKTLLHEGKAPGPCC